MTLGNLFRQDIYFVTEPWKALGNSGRKLDMLASIGIKLEIPRNLLPYERILRNPFKYLHEHRKT